MCPTITMRWRHWRDGTATPNLPPRFRRDGFAEFVAWVTLRSTRATRSSPQKTKRPAIRRPFQNQQIETRSDRSGDPLLQLRLRRGADLAGGHLAALEDHQGRDRHHAVFRGRLRALVDVQLHDLDLVAHRAGNLVEGGGDHAAGAAPFGPEVDDHRPGRLEHFGFEIGVRNLANGHGNYLVRLGITGRGMRIAPGMIASNL